MKIMIAQLVFALLVLALLVLATPMPASADIFAYKTDDGVFSYTDDRGKIPEKYRAGATAVVPLRSPEAQITVVGPEASEVTKRQSVRLDALRKSNEADRQSLRDERASQARAEAARPQTTIIIVQPRVERHGFPQRNRQHRHKGA